MSRLNTRQDIWDLRTSFREQLQDEQPIYGTFVKLASFDVIDVAVAQCDFIVIDLEHSALSDQQAIELLRYSTALAFPAIVRVASADFDRINHLLEAGAAGIQLSMVESVESCRRLTAASRYAPAGNRSISLSHPTGQFGAISLADYLAAEQSAPPILVGQIESTTREPLADIAKELDVLFVGTTDLAVSLGLNSDPEKLAAAVADISRAAASAGVPFGGWAPQRTAIPTLGLDQAKYRLIGSDLQMLASSMSQIRL